MTDISHVRALAMQIEEYAHYDGTEYGETSLLLVQLSRYASYVSEEFLTVLAAEMENHLDNYQTYATIVKTEETVVRPVVYLEWE